MMMDSINYILHKTYALDKIEKITLKKNVNIHSVSKAGLNVYVLKILIYHLLLNNCQCADPIKTTFILRDIKYYLHLPQSNLFSRY